MMSNTSIISFPKGRIIRNIETDKISDKEKFNNIQKHIVNTIIEDNASLLISRLALRGVDISSEAFKKNFILTIECLRSTIFETMGIEHPLQIGMREMMRTIEIYTKQ